MEKSSNLQRWIFKNSKDWITICGRNQSKIDQTEFFRLWEELEQNELYDVQWVLITCQFEIVAKMIHERTADFKQWWDKNFGA